MPSQRTLTISDMGAALSELELARATMDDGPTSDIEALATRQDAAYALPFRSDRSNYAHALSHIGEQYFFLRGKPDRETRAPDYGLQPLSRHPRFS